MQFLKSLVSTTFGKSLLWIIAILLATSMSLAGWIYLLKADLKVERAEKAVMENGLLLVSVMLEENRVNYEENLKGAAVIKEKIKVEYKTKIQIIEKWRENNATCSDAMGYLNTYNF